MVSYSNNNNNNNNNITIITIIIMHVVLRSQTVNFILLKYIT